MNWIAVALGGAIGACCRYSLTLYFPFGETRFPWATFIANGLGCFIMGIGFVLLTERLMLSDSWRHFLLVGGLGAFTTYSTFAIEAVLLLQKQEFKLALAYVLGTLVTCLVGSILGVSLAKTLFN
jgi:CrcB protein